MPRFAVRISVCALTLAAATAGPSAVAQTTRPASRPAAGDPISATRALEFAWPAGARVRVHADNRRETVADGAEPTDVRSFRLAFDLTTESDPDADDGGLLVGRDEVRTVRWNGQDVPARARAQLAPLELRTELLPVLRIRPDGRVRGSETDAALDARVETTVSRRAAAGELDAERAAELVALLTSRDHEALVVQASKAWDEWVGRFKDLDFRERADAEFDGEIELWTGDVVDGTFSAEHSGPLDGREGPGGGRLVRLAIEFVASGPRLDLAALKWKQRLLDTPDEPFRIVRLEFVERCESLMRPDTMQPAEVTTTRETTIHEGDARETILETVRWTFSW